MSASNAPRLSPRAIIKIGINPLSRNRLTSISEAAATNGSVSDEATSAIRLVLP